MFSRFAVNSYQSPALSLSAQRVVNARTVKAQQGSRTQTPVFRNPGIATLTTFADPVRGAALVGSTLVVVAGTTAYSVSSTGVKASMGTILGSNPTPSASGVGQAMFLADGDGYIVDTWATKITDGDFPYATQVQWSDGYFIVLAEDKVVVSDLNDGFAYDALAFDSLVWATQQPVAIKIVARDLIHFLPEAIAIGYNRGTVPYPYALASDGYIDLGCIAPRSPAVGDNTCFWLASDRTVRALRGNTPVRISTEPLEQYMADKDVTGAIGMFIAHAGTFEYVLTLPERTFTYNLATELWSERETYGLDHWDIGGTIEAHNRTYVWSGNSLGYLDSQTYTEFGQPQVVQLTSENLNDGVNWVHFDRVELDLDVGVGLSTGQGSDPLLMLEYSDDGGKTWSPTYQRSMGKIGETRKRVIFTRHGRSRSRVYRARYSDPTPFAFYGAWINEEQAIAA